MRNFTDFTTPAPVWDLPRDEADPPTLSPREWRLRNDSSLWRKAAPILAAARDPVAPRPEWLPKNMTELRGLNDPGLRLWRWSGREVDSKTGRNGEVVAQVIEAWRILAEADACHDRQAWQPSLRNQLAAAVRQRDASLAQVVRLLRERDGRGPIADEERR